MTLSQIVKPLVASIMLFGLSVNSWALQLKDGAPETYTVQKDDTLWGIASLFLQEPWQWPQLWRNNTQIENPHLIYPGDVLTITMIEGEPVIMVQRDKKRLTLSPETKRREKSAVPINVLPWSVIEPYLGDHEIMSVEDYEKLPYLLGNANGDIRFTSDDFVLSRRYGRPHDQYRVVRKQSTITNAAGEVLGVQVRHLADADMAEDKASGQWLVKLRESNEEAKRGDRLANAIKRKKESMQLQPAGEQRGFIVDNLHEHSLLGKHDIVVIDLGSDDIAPGTVLGIYQQGPQIIDGEVPKYANEGNTVASIFNDGSTVNQPAFKIGELVVFSSFDKTSYGIITRARTTVKTGAIVAAP